MKSETRFPMTKNLLCAVLASAGLSLAHVVHAAEIGAGAGANVQLGGSADAAAAGTDARAEGAADAQLNADGSVKQPMPMMQDSTRGMERAHERMRPGSEPEQAMGKKESDKKTAKHKREKKPAREEQ